jgi:APA family basic amino acid/polyamine antiporter
VVSSLFATALVALNYTESLVDQFTFIILLATLSTLVPYLLSALSELVHLRRDSRARAHAKPPTQAAIVALAALGYSIWAVVGSGMEIIAWGTLLMAAGLPLYWWQRKQNKKPARSGGD